MTDLTASIERPTKGAMATLRYGLVGYTDYQGGNTAYTVYKGAPVFIDVSDVDGYAQPAVAGITYASGDVFLGFALEQVSVTSADTAQASKDVLVQTRGLVGVPLGSLAVTDIGAAIYASDTNTFGTSTSDGLWVGSLAAVDASYAWIDIDQAAGQPSATTT